MTNQYRMKTEAIEAIYYDGNNKLDVENFMDMALMNDETDQLIVYKDGHCVGFIHPCEWVIKNKSDKGFHVCGPEAFDKTYEPVEPTTNCSQMKGVNDARR